jgi:hypothetical protein
VGLVQQEQADLRATGPGCPRTYIRLNRVISHMQTQELLDRYKCIRPLIGALLPAIMDISAHAI